ncbi:cytochrome P450 [Suillus clintonianus]|uniref:cytochrome P450 n=1 Tax=Suillus clintonianus TaxID=1904413 RepID=UPI001B86318C|nr:cytochrome P450 [Suillus clintonianus]KAG2156377.1 cytochrome P450 [Suillus clintonianus]
MLDTGPILYVVTSVLALASLAVVRKYLDDHSRPPLPPGPTPLPIVGNLLSLDFTEPWMSFNAWRSTYGDLIYARIFNKPILVVNSEEVAKDLFEERSNIYSDKPQSFIYEPFASNFNIAIMPYGDRWRLHRRIFHQTFRQAAAPACSTMQIRSAHTMLFNLLQDPANYPSHIHMFSAMFVLSMVYGYEPKAKGDQIIHNMEKYLELVTESMTPLGIAIMETFPFLLQLPSWFPGATFKRASVKCIQAGHDIKEIPFRYVEEKMSTDDAEPCMVTDLMNKMNGFEDDVIATAIKEAASMSFGAASDTTTSTLTVFLLAMVLNPEVQAKAQAEIDRVVGKDRLPDFDDRPAMPYVDAILRETLRWRPVVPFGIPHTSMSSDIYRGFFIPKGIFVLFNTWAMTHNETKYPSPNEFKPERFLHEDGSLTNDTMLLGFGWGRRSCVGRHIADSTLWIAMASILSTFSVQKALDEQGREIPVIPKFTTGVVVHPEKFPCRIVPRFLDGSAEMLRQMTGLGQP